MPQPLVLAIEPDLRQAAIVKRILREKVLADVAVVDSRDAALDAMRTTIPDVLLLSALMSPRDEDELIAHLRTLRHADHVQTHTIPLLASILGPAESRGPRGLLSAFRRRKEPEAVPSGCDPDLFAEEIRVFLQRAADKKRERANAGSDAPSTANAWRAAPPQQAAAATDSDPATETASTSSSWSSPFEWKPSTPSSPITDPESSIASPESLIAQPAPSPANRESLMAHLTPPAGIPTVDELSLPVHDGPVVTAAPIVHVAEPIQVEAPVQDSAPIQESAPIQNPQPIEDSRSGTRDAGVVIRDERSGMRDSRPARFGALASWARSENGGRRDAAHDSDDLRGLLTGLAVPSGVVAVGYGRGCRIRRVRVPAAREPQEAEAVGAVILSRRVLAEQRDRRDQPRA